MAAPHATTPVVVMATAAQDPPGQQRQQRALYTACSRVELKANRILPFQELRAGGSGGSGPTTQQSLMQPLHPPAMHCARSVPIAPGFYARVRLANPATSSSATFRRFWHDGAAEVVADSRQESFSSLHLRPSIQAPASTETSRHPSQGRMSLAARLPPSISAAAWRSSTPSFVHRQKLLKCDTPVNRAMSSSNTSQSAVMRALWVSK